MKQATKQAKQGARPRQSVSESLTREGGRGRVIEQLERGRATNSFKGRNPVTEETRPVHPPSTPLLNYSSLAVTRRGCHSCSHSYPPCLPQGGYRWHMDEDSRVRDDWDGLFFSSALMPFCPLPCPFFLPVAHPAGTKKQKTVAVDCVRGLKPCALRVIGRLCPTCACFRVTLVGPWRGGFHGHHPRIQML